MLFIVTQENRELFRADIAEMHRQRKRVFVDRCGWSIPTVQDMEIDQYDRDDTIYLISKSAPRTIEASLRLLPTEKPHLLSDVFSAACDGPPPRGPSVWEISRFCISPEVRSRRERAGVVPRFVCGVIETALLFGVELVTFATHQALLPLVLDCGWKVIALGRPIPDGNDSITAVAAAITPAALQKVRKRFGVPRPLTRYLTPAQPLDRAVARRSA